MTIRSFQSLVSKNRIQFLVLGVALAGFLGAFVILNYSSPTIFERFLGDLNPLVISIIIAIIGIAVLSFLLSKGKFPIYRKNTALVFFGYSLPVVPFVLVAIWVDWNIVYPADIHILMPESLLFYPAMGLLVEILFHALPLTILLFIFPFVFETIESNALVWLSIIIVAMVEPTYQIFMDTYPTWALVVVWINLFLFNLVQLYVFKLYGFISMYGLRLVYYLFWHIIWGSLRIDLLF